MAAIHDNLESRFKLIIPDLVLEFADSLPVRFLSFWIPRLLSTVCYLVDEIAVLD